MSKYGLRKEYDQLLSDMLVMQYRVEVFRRRMQIAQSSFGIGVRLQTSVEDVVSELVQMSTNEFLREEEKKAWWSR
jgi:hypothetical protein